MYEPPSIKFSVFLIYFEMLILIVAFNHPLNLFAQTLFWGRKLMMLNGVILITGDHWFINSTI